MIFFIIRILLLFYLQQYTVQPQFIQMPDNLVASYISLRLPLLSSHFNGCPPATTSGLTLKCTAHVANLYDRTSEVELGTPQRDPIPARGKHAFNLLRFRLWTSYIGLYVYLCVKNVMLFIHIRINSLQSSILLCHYISIMLKEKIKKKNRQLNKQTTKFAYRSQSSITIQTHWLIYLTNVIIASIYENIEEIYKRWLHIRMWKSCICKNIHISLHDSIQIYDQVVNTVVLSILLFCANLF